MEQQECLNPGESLLDMYTARSRYQRNIKINTDPNNPDASPVALRFYKKELEALNAKIAEVEHAGQTGGMIRIM